MENMFEHATSHKCRAEIAEKFSYHINAIALEKSLPFSSETSMRNECPIVRSQFLDKNSGVRYILSLRTILLNFSS